MNSVWLYTLASVGVVSLISLVGIFGLALNEQRLKSWLFYLISFSAGALLGDVFLHIFPEIGQKGFSVSTGAYVLVGIVIFFLLEKVMHWHHAHGEHSEDIHAVVYLTQAGDTLHNFIDGVIIAASYLISPAVGFATTLAVIFHEIPQEIGNFAIFVHGGWSARKALFYNFLSALASILGAVCVLAFSGRLANVPDWLVAMAASSFIYIALSDLLPEMAKEKSAKKSAYLLAALVLGMVVMGLLLRLE